MLRVFHQTFVGHQCGTSSRYQSVAQNFEVGSRIFGKFVHPWVSTLNFKHQNGHFCPLFCLGIGAKTDIFVQKHVCRFFTLNTILTGQYANVNIMQAYYRLKTNLSVVLYAMGACRGMEIIYHTVVYSTLLRDTYSALCSSTCTYRYLWYPSNINVVG